MTPVSRVALIARLRSLGFSGPYRGGRHQFMLRQDVRVTLPSDHGGDISVGLPARLLVQAGVTRDEWLTQES